MKKILAIIVVVLVILLAFWYLNGSGANTVSDSSLSVSGSTSGSDSVDAQYIYSLLQQMSQVKSQGNLDDSLFADPAFQGLKDNTVTFSAEPAGRINPFAPLGSTDAPSAASTTINVRIK